VHGTLTLNPTHTAIGNATVALLKYNATSKQYDITLATTKTNNSGGALGAYTFSVKEMKAGTYYYELTYAGTATFTRDERSSDRDVAKHQDGVLLCSYPGR
jgi:hypothetical protein